MTIARPGRSSNDDPLSNALIDGLIAEPFIPRQWLTQQIERHFRDPECQMVFVTGEAGVGKSALAARTARTEQLAPRYFIRVDSRTRHAGIGAVEILLSVGRQLAILRPDAFADQDAFIHVDMRVGRAAAGSSQTAIEAGEITVHPFKPFAVQISQRANLLEGQLTAIRADRIVADPRLLDVETLQQMGLFDPAHRLLELDPHARIVVVIDALDELDLLPAPTYSVADWLAECPRLPANVRVLLTSRPHDHLRRIALHQYKRVREVAIGAKETNAIKDVRSYAEKICEDQAFATALRRHGVNLRRAADGAAMRAAGNFLFIVSWFRALRSCVEDDDTSSARALADFDDLPSGLDGLYELFLHLIRNRARDRSWNRAVHPLLSSLAVCRAPLGSEQLIAWSGLTDQRAEAALALREMRHLVVTEPGDSTLRLLHTSVGEYLTSATLHDDAYLRRYYVDPVASNRGLAQQILRAYGPDWSNVTDDYALAHVIGHLVAVIEAATDGGAEADDCAKALTSLIGNRSYTERRAARLGFLDLLSDCLQAHRVLTVLWPGRAQTVVEAVAEQAVIGEASSQDSELDADKLHAALAYRSDSQDFYGALLKSATNAEFLAARIGEDDLQRVRREFVRLRSGQLRRSGDVTASDNLLGELLADSRATAAERSKDLYDRAYAQFLRGEIVSARTTMLRSAEAARQAGDEVRHWISRIIAAQFAYYANLLSPADYQAELRQAVDTFEAADRPAGSLAERWLMNAHAHLFELAVFEEDLPTAEAEREILDADPWISRSQKLLYRERFNARLALLRGQAHRSCDHYETLLGVDVLATGTPPDNEGVARDLLDYGRALYSAGRADEACAAWRLALTAPDDAASWLWKPTAQHLLDEHGTSAPAARPAIPPEPST